MVANLEQQGEKETVKILKETLFRGDVKNFMELLQKHYGVESYNKLCDIMFISMLGDKEAEDEFKSFLEGKRYVRKRQ